MWCFGLSTLGGRDFHAQGRVVHRAWPGCPRARPPVWRVVRGVVHRVDSERVCGFAAVDGRTAQVDDWGRLRSGGTDGRARDAGQARGGRGDDVVADASTTRRSSPRWSRTSSRSGGRAGVGGRCRSCRRIAELSTRAELEVAIVAAVAVAGLVPCRGRPGRDRGRFTWTRGRRLPTDRPARPVLVRRGLRRLSRRPWMAARRPGGRRRPLELAAQSRQPTVTSTRCTRLLPIPR